MPDTHTQCVTHTNTMPDTHTQPKITAGNYGGQVGSGGGAAQTYGGFGGEGGD